MNKIRLCAAVIGCAGLLSASANTITVNTATGPAAQAIFDTGLNSLSITLRNLEKDPADVTDCLSALIFSFASGENSGSLVSGLGMERTIKADGTFSNGSTVAAGWVLSGTSTGLMLDVLAGFGHAGPKHTIIGDPADSGSYEAANNSITGNGAHNPFLAGDVTFNLTVDGLTEDTILKNVIFQFGTTPGENREPGDTPPVPDGGTTVLLLGAAISGLALVRRKLS